MYNLVLPSSNLMWTPQYAREVPPRSLLQMCHMRLVFLWLTCLIECLLRECDACRLVLLCLTCARAPSTTLLCTDSTSPCAQRAIPLANCPGVPQARNNKDWGPSRRPEGTSPLGRARKNVFSVRLNYWRLPRVAT